VVSGVTVTGPAVPEAQLESQGNLVRRCTLYEIRVVVERLQAHETASATASELVCEHDWYGQDKHFEVEEAMLPGRLGSTLTIQASSVKPGCDCCKLSFLETWW